MWLATDCELCLCLAVLKLHDASHMPLRQNFALLCCASSDHPQRPINWDACAPLLVHVFVNLSVVEAIRPLFRSLVARIPFVLHKGPFELEFVVIDHFFLDRYAGTVDDVFQHVQRFLFVVSS